MFENEAAKKGGNKKVASLFYMPSYTLFSPSLGYKCTQGSYNYNTAGDGWMEKGGGGGGRDGFSRSSSSAPPPPLGSEFSARTERPLEDSTTFEKKS